MDQLAQSVGLLACQHRGDAAGFDPSPFGPQSYFACRHHRHPQQTTAAACVTCPDWYAVVASVAARVSLVDAVAENAPPLPAVECCHPLGVIVDRYGRDAGVADLFRGAAAFLCLGGPSMKTLPLDLLARRGCLILSFNNNVGALPSLPWPLRPHVWLHTDPCGKFHDSIWRDPGVLKIVPVREWNPRGEGKGLRYRRAGSEEFIDWRMVPKDMPGVLGFHRNTTFDPEHWLWESTINRGNDEKGSKANGYPHTINTMFAAVRLAFYLGVSRLYLVGADFRMEPEQPYAFGQAKSVGGCRSNNSAFADMCVMFDALKPRFDAAGFEVLNCTPNSGLWTFPFVDLIEAVHRETIDIEQELRCHGWYEKSEEPKETQARSAGG